MFEVDPLAVHFDHESILWFFVRISSTVDQSTYKFDPKSFLKFQVEISKKLFELDPGWFYDFKLKIKDVESRLIKSWPWLWIDFMISSWNVEND